MTQVTVYRAVDAFLYLPTYIAEYEGIFSTIKSDLKVEFVTAAGDSDAIRRMCSDDKSGNNIPLALCDPLTAFSNRVDFEEPDTLRVVAAIIDRPPFWAVNGISERFKSINDFRGRFRRLICYGERLVTGNFIGNSLANICRTDDILSVPFGDEIPTLLNCYKADSVPTVAITADVISLAQARHLSPPVNINYCFSQDARFRQFLTTGIVTTERVCKEHATELRHVLEGIQKSILVLRSSKPIAYRVCSQLAQRDEFYRKNQSKLNDDEIQWIIDTIHQEQFYPASLLVSREHWDAALNARAGVEQWKPEELAVAQRLYQKCVVTKLAIESKKFIVREFDGSGLLSVRQKLSSAISVSEQFIFGDSVYRWIVLLLVVLGTVIPETISIMGLPVKWLCFVASIIVLGASIVGRVFALHFPSISPKLKWVWVFITGLAGTGLLYYGYSCEQGGHPGGIYFAGAAILATIVIELLKTPHREAIKKN